MRLLVTFLSSFTTLFTLVILQASLTLALPSTLYFSNLLGRTRLPRDIAGSQCTAGPVLCCITVQPASDTEVASLLGLMGVQVDDGNTPVGVSCAPVPMIGLGNRTCSTPVVCCEKNKYNGLVATGCQNATINQ